MRQQGEAGEDRADLRLLRLVVLGTMPVVVVGLGWKDELQSLFSAPVHIGFAFLFTGLLLWLSRFAGRPTKDLAGTTWIDALLIGLAQALALVPGVSRSGATISIALLMGLDRRLAARYSFLLAIPAILGAITVQTADMGGISADQWAAVGAGTVMAAASGYVALRLLLRIVVAGRLFQVCVLLLDDRAGNADRDADRRILNRCCISWRKLIALFRIP